MKTRAVLFVGLISLIGLVTVARFPTETIKNMYAGYGGGIRGILLMVTDRTTWTNTLSENMILHDRWIDLFGGAQRMAGVDVIEGTENRVYRLRGNRLTFLYSDKGTLSDKELASVRALKQAADAVSARSLFVVTPRKPCGQTSVFMVRGIRTKNEDTDNYRAKVFADAGFETLDLHKRMHEQGKDHASMYFRTDHHWTAHTALWAAAEIGKELGVDSALLEPSRFAAEEHPGILLGSEGKHCGRLYCSPDDLDILIPTFDTSLTLQIENDTPQSGTFRETLLFYEQLQPKPYAGYFPYSVYLNGDHGFLSIQNRQNPDGKRLLLIKDSFGNSVAPYLALCCAQVDCIDTRHYKGSVSEHVAAMQPDAVCVMMSAGTANQYLCFE